MIWSKGTTRIPDAKLKAFKELPSPNTPKRTKSLVCALSYYRHFIPRFADLSKPLMDLSNLTPREFKWTDEHEKCLRTLIQAFLDNSKTYLPDPEKPFFVQTDASHYCAGGRVFQKDAEGNERIVSAFSRTFSKTERAYGIFKKEVVSLLYTLRSMDFFLRYASKLTILVDAKSIVYLKMCKDSEGILMRFSLELSKYDAEIYHIPGDENVVSDVLSRFNPEIGLIVEEEGRQ